jgi:hypothetical protein
MNNPESGDRSPNKTFKIKRELLFQGPLKFLSFIEKTDGIHTLEYLKRQRFAPGC